MFTSAKDGMGFQLTFANGYTISVQWHKSAYSENVECGEGESNSAEVAFFDPHDEFVKNNSGQTLILGWQSTDNVAKLIAIVSDRFAAPETIRARLCEFE